MLTDSSILEGGNEAKCTDCRDHGRSLSLADEGCKIEGVLDGRSQS